MGNGNLRHPFFESVQEVLDAVEATQMLALRKAACVTADSLTAGGMIHVFGTGHSHMLAEEIFFRSGGLVQVNAMLDPGLMLHVSALSSTSLEQVEGYAPIVLKRYDLRTGDVMVVISNSGRNAVPIDAALVARAQGLTVIAVTAAAAYRSMPIRHSSGRHLAEYADVVIDTCVPKGDAALSLPGVSEPMGPLSTIIGATVLQTYIYETAKEILERGHRPQIILSANGEVLQDHERLFTEAAPRIRHR
jgi:uncharacterized phosphosugar-binding protein